MEEEEKKQKFILDIGKPPSKRCQNVMLQEGIKQIHCRKCLARFKDKWIIMNWPDFDAPLISLN